MSKRKILVRGPALSRSGYGEQARFALRSLRSREDLFDIYIQPLQWGNTSWMSDMDEERVWIDQNKHPENDISLVCWLHCQPTNMLIRQTEGQTEKTGKVMERSNQTLRSIEQTRKNRRAANKTGINKRF